MKAVITTHTESFTIELNDLATDPSQRKKARIDFKDIRSLAKRNDDKTIEIIFTNGEIKGMSYENIDEIDGDTDITSQSILYNKLETAKYT